MVFFVCDGCQETLKKNKVEAHRSRCRSAWVFSCVDCGVRYEGDAFKAHTSCISEAEKHQGSLYVAKKSTGANIQQRWTDFIPEFCSAFQSNDKELEAVMKQISSLDNIPRKEKKFMNFMMNSTRTSNRVIEAAWKHISGAFDKAEKELKDEKSGDTAVKINEEKESKTEKKESKKRKRSEEETSEKTSKDKKADKEQKKKKNDKKKKDKDSKSNKEKKEKEKRDKKRKSKNNSE